MDVLRLVAEGRTNREIASALVISDHTVRRHLQNIFNKIGVSSRAAATAFAFQRHLV
jgi:DNA-binding NarL/FixJ family response regulator